MELDLGLLESHILSYSFHLNAGTRFFLFPFPYECPSGERNMSGRQEEI